MNVNWEHALDLQSPADGTTRFIFPQFGIFVQGTHAHHFLEFDPKPGVTPTQAVAAFGGLRAPDVSVGGVNLVLAFGAGAWRAVAYRLLAPRERRVLLRAVARRTERAGGP